MVVAVVFKGDFGSKKYNYRCEFNILPGDKVLVPVGNYGHVEVAHVVATWLDEVDGCYGSIPSFDLKSIIAPADMGALIEMRGNEIKAIWDKYEKWFSKAK